MIEISMQEFFQQNNISWKESQMHGVICLKSRQYWDKRWEEVMSRTYLDENY
jgi:deoxyribodipyrimidine photo-lyase